MLEKIETVEYSSNKTVVYRTQTVATYRIEIMPEDDIEECLDTVMDAVTFVGRGSKYGTDVIKLSTK